MIFKRKPYPKIEYKKGVYNLNPKNLFDCKSWTEAEELFFACLDEVKRREDKYDKIHLFVTTMYYHLGKYITKKCFYDILDYVDLTYEDILSFITYEKKQMGEKHFERAYKYNLNWFYRLDEEYKP